MKSTIRNKKHLKIHIDYQDLSDLKVVLNNIHALLLYGSKAKTVRNATNEFTFEVIDLETLNEEHLNFEAEIIDFMHIMPRIEIINKKSCLIYESKMNFPVK